MSEASKKNERPASMAEWWRALKRELLHILVGTLLVLGGLAATSVVVSQFELATVPWYSVVLCVFITPAVLYAGYCREEVPVGRVLGVIWLSVVLTGVAWGLAGYFELEKTVLGLARESGLWQVVVPWSSLMISSYLIYWKAEGGGRIGNS